LSFFDLLSVTNTSPSDRVDTVMSSNRSARAPFVDLTVGSSSVACDRPPGSSASDEESEFELPEVSLEDIGDDPVEYSKNGYDPIEWFAEDSSVSATRPVTGVTSWSAGRSRRERPTSKIIATGNRTTTTGTTDRHRSNFAERGGESRKKAVHFNRPAR